MKFIGLFSFLLLTTLSLSQKIDYNHFDNDRASKVLFEELNKFRDTITISGSDRKMSEVCPDYLKYEELRKLTWSDKVYNLISIPNCRENIKQDRLFHVDKTDWWENEDNRKLFRNEIYVKPLDYFSNYFIYNENGGKTVNKFETYQEMAKYMIDAWDVSTLHRSLQRSILYSRRHFKNNVKIKVIAACYVEYSNGKTWFFTNIIYVP